MWPLTGTCPSRGVTSNVEDSKWNSHAYPLGLSKVNVLAVVWPTGQNPKSIAPVRFVFIGYNYIFLFNSAANSELYSSYSAISFCCDFSLFFNFRLSYLLGIFLYGSSTLTLYFLNEFLQLLLQWYPLFCCFVTRLWSFLLISHYILYLITRILYLRFFSNSINHAT